MIPEGFIEVGVKIPLLVLGWLALAFLIISVVTLFLSFLADVVEFAVLPILVFVCLFIAWVCFLFPFQSAYHHVYRVEGHVESVSNVLSESSGDLTRTPVIELDTVDRPITMNDPRAVTLEGKDVTLTCSIGWNYQAADTYSCSIYAIGDTR